MIKKPSKKADILLQQIGSDTLLYNPNKGNVHVLNITAVSVWKLCDGSHAIEDIVDSLKKDYHFSEEINITKDVTEIINKFLELEVIV